jgi:hypothetical protein
MAGMAEGRDGHLYMACGTLAESSLYAYDRSAGKFIAHGRLYDPQLNTQAARIHDIAITDDLVIYAGENDNTTRSSYLWELRIGLPDAQGA